MLTLDAPAGVKPLLVIAIGNPSRGDDALGPRLAQRLAALDLPDVEVLTDFQLQVEHALDLIGRREVVFVDATAAGDAPFTFVPARAQADASFSSHALSPGAVLECLGRLGATPLPHAHVLAIRGHGFALGTPPTRAARANLDAAFDHLAAWLAHSRERTT
jgi:hydrogenase maturation protease